MTLRRNIVATYFGQFYVALIGITMVPLYIRFMGAEAYGLVGFFSMLQIWFSLLDFGLTPTVARETARFKGAATTAAEYLRLVRALEIVFLFVAVSGCLAILCSAGYISTDWLKSDRLANAEIRESIQLMAFAISMRWMCGLYRGTISGAERLVFLSMFSSSIASLRFVAVIPLLAYVDAKPTTFFSFQVAVGVIELSGLMFVANRLLPSGRNDYRFRQVLSSLKSVVGFSMTIAFTTAVWAVVTQTDKLVLSKILPLAEYAYFTLAVLVASGVLMLGGPISAAILPRMARLEAEGDHAAVIRVYRQATQFVAVIAGSSAVTLALAAKPLLWAWTGDALLAREAAPILTLYALGNGIMAVAAFPYYLQYAKGDLRLHLIGNAIFVVLLIPAIIIAARKYGGIGAGYVWLTMNALLFVAWLPLVHRKFEPGLNRLWYVHDTLLIFAVVGAVGVGLSRIMPQWDNRIYEIGAILVTGGLVLAAGVLASSGARAQVSRFVTSKVLATWRWQ